MILSTISLQPTAGTRSRKARCDFPQRTSRILDKHDGSSWLLRNQVELPHRGDDSFGERVRKKKQENRQSRSQPLIASSSLAVVPSFQFSSRRNDNIHSARSQTSHTIEKHALTTLQERLVPDQAQSYPTYRLLQQQPAPTFDALVASLDDVLLASSTSIQHTCVEGVVLVMSPDALLIRSRCGRTSQTTRCRFSIHLLGEVVALDDRAASAALLTIAQFPCESKKNTHQQQSLFVHRHSSSPDRGASFLTANELGTLFSTNRLIEFLDFEFSWCQLLALTQLPQPISFSLSNCLSSKQHVAAFLRALSDRTEVFGRLHIPDYTASDSLAALDRFAWRLVHRRTVLLDNLDATLVEHHHHDEQHDNNDDDGNNSKGTRWLVSLLSSRWSIRRLCIWVTIDNAAFWKAAAQAIADGRCPTRLQLRRLMWRPAYVPEMRSVVQALKSPHCCLREFMVFPQAPSEWFVDALSYNSSLEHIVFPSSSVAAFRDPQVLQAIVDHPKIKLITVEEAIDCAGDNEAFSHTLFVGFLSFMLKQKRQLRIAFSQGSGKQTWEAAVEPAVRFNLYHHGVVDRLSVLLPSHCASLKKPSAEKETVFLLALLHGVHDPARLGLVLHHHTPLVIDALEDACSLSSSSLGPPIRKRAKMLPSVSDSKSNSRKQGDGL